ncbi:MAG: CopG family transcriptional regulator [Candidatus Latescibacterota bacterium]|nr:MAG: CopG family transcriptional regulator [Candidatus Latescibacterota bacterium]
MDTRSSETWRQDTSSCRKEGIHMGELRTITVSLPSEMVKEVERLGNIEGKAPSELFREALRLYIRRKRWEVIREYGAKKASELGIKEEDLEEIIDDYRSEEEARKSCG